MTIYEEAERDCNKAIKMWNLMWKPFSEFFTEAIKEKNICSVCQKEVLPPVQWWESVKSCSDCVRKAALEIQKKEKNICCQCGAEIDEENWIPEQAMCIGCFNEFVGKHQYD